MCFESRYRGESTENRVGIEFAVAGTKHVDFYVFPPKVVVASPPRLKKRLHVADGTKATGPPILTVDLSIFRFRHSSHNFG